MDSHLGSALKPSNSFEAVEDIPNFDADDDFTQFWDNVDSQNAQTPWDQAYNWDNVDSQNAQTPWDQASNWDNVDSQKDQTPWVQVSNSDTPNFDPEAEFEKYWEKPSVDFDTRCIQSVKNAATHFGYSSMEIISGALHDACNLSLHGPTSMIFIPCKDGLSHNEAEYADPAHVAAGGNVLLHSVLEHAL